MNKHIDQLNQVFGVDDSGAAKLLGLDKGTISRYRSGMTNPPRDKMRHIETLLILNPEQREQIKGERLV